MSSCKLCRFLLILLERDPLTTHLNFELIFVLFFCTTRWSVPCPMLSLWLMPSIEAALETDPSSPHRRTGKGGHPSHHERGLCVCASDADNVSTEGRGRRFWKRRKSGRGEGKGGGGGGRGARGEGGGARGEGRGARELIGICS